MKYIINHGDKNMIDKVEIHKLNAKLQNDTVIDVYENGTNILCIEFGDGDMFEILEEDGNLRIKNPNGE